MEKAEDIKTDRHKVRGKEGKRVKRGIRREVDKHTGKGIEVSRKKTGIQTDRIQGEEQESG